MEPPNASGGGAKESHVDCVKVCVRVRPLAAKERDVQLKNCLRVVEAPLEEVRAKDNDRATVQRSSGKAQAKAQQLIVGKDRAFTFDHVLGVDNTQRGYNATVLAYGQTGTGKTHTMSGPMVDSRVEQHDDNDGIIPRVIKDVFELMHENQQQVEYNLKVEYIEIYNEELHDLLHPETPSRQISIRENSDGHILLAGVKSKVAQTREDVFRYFMIGSASRATGSTLMNEHSSRSHAIFSLILSQRDLACGECRKSKFHLVDLAGSERAKRTGAIAGRLKESVSINQGLLALGNVISALADDSNKSNKHIPYRDSKLTRLLQDSLGGNAKTLMIACVSPAAINFEETLNTLKYANRAKNIKNRPIVNQQTQEANQQAEEEMQRMKLEIAALHNKLQQEKQQQPLAQSQSANSAADKNQENDDLMKARVVSLQQQLNWFKQHNVIRQANLTRIKVLAMEAITALVAMEKDIKPLGRSVQHRLNEIVKVMNSSIQLLNKDANESQNEPDQTADVGSSVVASAEPKPEKNRQDQAGLEELRIIRHELAQAKENLARDEEIFDLKTNEIQRLQQALQRAESQHTILLQRVQELEKSGQLWCNSERKSLSASTALATSVNPIEVASGERESAVKSSCSKELDATASSVGIARCGSFSKRSSSNERDGDGINVSIHPSSSKGLFTKRKECKLQEEIEDDQVLIGTFDDEPADPVKTLVPPPNRPVAFQTQALRAKTTESALSSSSSSKAEAAVQVINLQQVIMTLRKQLEDMQIKQGEASRAKEETSRRWELERQQYEKRLNEFEQRVESLQKSKAEADEALGEERKTNEDLVVQVQELQLQLQQLQRENEHKQHQESTACKTKKSWISTQLICFYQEQLQKLINYTEAQRHVQSLLQSKQQTEANKSQVSKQKNALEMNMLRQSLSLQSSISEVSKSIQELHDKLQSQELTAVQERDRLSKLKQRAETKLAALQSQQQQQQDSNKDGQQELDDLQELIEDLSSHIAFQDAELVKARAEMMARGVKTAGPHRVPRADSPEDHEQLKELSPLEAIARAVLEAIETCEPDTQMGFMQDILQQALASHFQQQEHANQTKQHDTALQDRDTAIHQLESGLSAAQQEFDRIRVDQTRQIAQLMAALEQSHHDLDETRQILSKQQQNQLVALQPPALEVAKDQEWQKLIVSNQKKDEYIAEIEKHLVFFKAKSKQMQTQLQQLLACQGDLQDHGSSNNNASSPLLSEQYVLLQKRIDQLQQANDALTRELADAKLYLRNSRTQPLQQQVIRVSRSELRELPPPN